MTYLLHIEASPGGEASHSTGIARELLDAYAQRNTQHEIVRTNIWDLELPAFDAQMIAAKFAVLRKQNATDEQQALWARAVSFAQAFNLADIYVISLPMWNFGIPYRLKHYIDVVTLPEQNWAWSKTGGYQALLRDKRAVLVYSSAGDFSGSIANPNDDFQKPYMRQWLRFVGIDVVKEIVVAPTLTDPAHLADIKQRCLEEARETAAQL